MSIAFVLLMLAGIGLVGLPIGLGIAGIELSGGSSLILTVSGIGFIVVSGILLTVTKLYIRTRANEAFVRTGMGGLKVVQDGGALVIPILHECVRITLETIRLEVTRDGSNALITKDNLRCDIGAEFYVRVEANTESISQSSRSLGDKMRNVGALKDTVQDKLISALRSVAATRELSELHADREKFVADVTQAVNEDLAKNGLTLESVTISKLDQTDTSALNPNNIFDARGMRTIADITERQRTEKNKLERENEQARKQQDVETAKQILAFEQDEKNARATQEAEVAKVAAAQEQAAKEKEIEKEQAIEAAEIKKQQSIEIANRKKEQEIAIAEEQKRKAAEVAAEERQKSVATAEQERAVVETEKAKAEQFRTTEQEKIKTIQITAEANRKKEQAVIDAQAKAEEEYVSQQRSADAKAYTIQKDADARKAAADADAEAKIKQANAQKQAELAQVEASRAREMIPVDVRKAEVAVGREQVSVDQERFNNITKPELQVRDEFGQSAQQFEISKLQVEAQKEVEIAAAQAAGRIFERVQANLYGTPDQVTTILGSLMKGHQFASNVEGLAQGLTGKGLSEVAQSPEVQKAAKTVAQTVKNSLERPEQTPVPRGVPQPPVSPAKTPKQDQDS